MHTLIDPPSEKADERGFRSKLREIAEKVASRRATCKSNFCLLLKYNSISYTTQASNEALKIKLHKRLVPSETKRFETLQKLLFHFSSHAFHTYES